MSSDRNWTLDAVEEYDLNEGNDSCHSPEVENTELLKPPVTEEVLKAVRGAEHLRRLLCIVVAGKMAMALGHQDSPEYKRIEESVHVNHGEEQTEVNPLAIRLGWR